MNKTIRFFVLSLFVFCCINQVFSQSIFIGGGYNLSYSRLRGVNNFINAYNLDPNKTSGWVFNKPVKNLHFLTGACLSVSVEYNDFLADVTWVRRQTSSFANYDIPSHDERWMGYKAGTLAFGLSKKLLEFGKFQVYGGGSLDFSKMKVRTYLLSEGKDAWRNTDSSGNFGICPSLNFIYRPFDNFPVVLMIKPYYQMNLATVSSTGLSTEMPGNYTGEDRKLKSSGGNLGIMFQVCINLMALKDIKLPEKKQAVVETVIQDIVVKGTVVDAYSGHPIDAVVTFYIADKPSSSFVTSEGNYLLNSAKFVTYTIETKAFGYQTRTETLVVSANSGNPIIHNIELSRIPMGQAFKLENILFEKASAKLLPESDPELYKLYRFLNANQSVEIEISGHTSSEGNDEYNQKLSQERASSIAADLINKGIVASRIKAKGYGESKPISTNETEEGRKLNRRVEIKITKQ